ncbi:MAG TPA: hypothetical protein PLF68_09140 [Nitrospira sp.]|nr:hypothetical protein [Nitrospira sp.]
MLLQSDDQFFEQRGALCGLGAGTDSEFVILVCLILRRLFPEQPPNRFPKGEFGSGANRFAVRKSIATQIVDLSVEFAQCGDAASEFFDGVRFRSAALRLACFRSCHAYGPSREKSLSERRWSDKKSLPYL